MKTKAAADPKSDDEAFAFLPADCVIRDAEAIEKRYLRNVTGLKRAVPLALCPNSTAQIPAIIAEANKLRIALYPFSTGKNWGMGSKLPVTDGCVILDLSRLNRIVEVNAALRYAVLEPGVTQSQLATYLAKNHSSFSFNLTGNIGETSILGNTLDRGDGSHARIDDLIAVKGILGDGTPFEVGGHSGMSGEDTSHVMRYAAGPDLVGLFSQSNFGIITQIVFRLMPRADKRNVFWGIVENAKLPELFDRLQIVYAQRIITSPASVNIGYANRFEQARSTLGDKTADMRFTGQLWNFYIIFDGSIKLSKTIFEELHAHLDSCCTETGDYESTGDPDTMPPQHKPLIEPLKGNPDNLTIAGIYKLTNTPLPEDAKDMDADQLPIGMKSIVAVVPPVGEHVRKAADIIAGVRDQFKVNTKDSFFGDGRFLITVHYLRADPAQADAAEQAQMAIWNRLRAAGYMPYRVPVDRMEQLVASRPDFFSLVGKIKEALDPQGIISPGRYAPTP
jgi:4-cresol dehydrogenase (hydroxylating)